MTDAPSVTCPSPARTTLPLRRMDKTVVERISRFVDIGAVVDYSSGERRSGGGEKAFTTETQRHREGNKLECSAPSEAESRFFFCGVLRHGWNERTSPRV